MTDNESKNNNTSNNNTSNIIESDEFVDVPITPNTPIAVGTLINQVTMDLNPKMLECIRRAKIVNIYCLIDIIFATAYSFIYPNFFIILLCSLTGYFGSKSFNHTLILLYITFLIFSIIFRLINFIYIISTINYNMFFINFIYFFFLFVFEIFITVYVLFFYGILKNLSELERQYLRTNKIVQKKFICNC